MGDSPQAILAYGYNLGDIASHFEWDYDGDVESGGPGWFDQDNDEDMATPAMAALLRVAGLISERYESMSSAEQQAAEKTLGIHLVRHSGVEAEEMLLLAVRVIDTDWEDVLPVSAEDLAVPENAEERLTWALDVLGISRPAPDPQWLLAAHYS